MLERVRDWKWWGEQALHAGLGAVAALPVILQGGAWPVWGSVAAASLLAGVREYEQRPVNSWGDLAADVAFTVAGGLAVGGGVAWS